MTGITSFWLVEGGESAHRPGRENPVCIYIYIYMYVYIYIYLICNHEITQAMQFAETSFLAFLHQQKVWF